MRLSFLIISIAVFSMIGCKEELSTTLSDEKIVDILTDLHLAEASMLTLNKRLKDSVNRIYYGQVFEIHQVEDSIFFNDLEIIRKNPKRVEEIYTLVIDNIDQLDLNEKKEEEVLKKKK